MENDQTRPPDEPRALDPIEAGDIDARIRDLARIASQAASRSPLYRWLDAIHDDLMDAGGRIYDWDPLCRYATERGIKDGRGNLPTPRRMSRLWQKIRRRRSGRATTRTAQSYPTIESPGQAHPLVETRAEPDAATHPEPGTSLVTGRARFAEAMARQQQPHALRPVTAKTLAERSAAPPESKAVPDGDPGSLTAAVDGMRAAAIRRGPF